MAEYYETDRARPLADDRLEVTLPTKDLRWVAKLVLRLAGQARVLDPPELAGMVADAAEATLALYRRRQRTSQGTPATRRYPRRDDHHPDDMPAVR